MKLISEHGRVHQEPSAPGHNTSLFTGVNRITLFADGADTAYVPTTTLWKPSAINLGIAWQLGIAPGTVTVNIFGTLAPVELATSTDTGIQSNVPWFSVKSAAAEQEAGVIVIPYTVLKFVFSAACSLYLAAA